MVRDPDDELVQRLRGGFTAQGTEIDAFRNFIYAMLGLTVVIALVGIANTTTLSITERGREIGLLRAVGATGSGIRRMVLLEAALLAVVGAAVGLGIALGGGWALITITGGTELGSIAVPWMSLAIMAIGAILAGTLAAAYPAWRASRQPVLEAVSST